MLKEKMRATEEEISKFDKRLAIGDIRNATTVEKLKGKMRAEGEISKTTLALAHKITAIQEIRTSACDKNVFVV